jgi:hypothetical protein
MIIEHDKNNVAKPGKSEVNAQQINIISPFMVYTQSHISYKPYLIAISAKRIFSVEYNF